MPFFESSGTRIFYTSRGEGPVLLFQHGLGADHLQSLAATAGLEGHRVLAMDAPGHGESPGGKGRYGFARFADDALALLDHLEVRSAVVGGISMGAGIGLALALRAPERVDGLVLVRPAWLDAPSPANLRIISLLGEWIACEGIEGARRRLEQHPLYATAVTANPGCAASLAGALTRPQAEASASVLCDMVADAPFSDMAEVAGVDVRAVVVGNDDDPLHPAGMARTLAEHLPRGHHVHAPSRYRRGAEHQAVLTDTLQRFLETARREEREGT